MHHSLRRRSALNRINCRYKREHKGDHFFSEFYLTDLYADLYEKVNYVVEVFTSYEHLRINMDDLF